MSRGPVDPGVRTDVVGFLAALGMTLLLVIMIARVAQLQISPSPQLAAYARERTSSKTELPVRGDLMDRRGRLLAATHFGYRVFVDPTLLPDPPDEAIMAIASATGEPPARVGERIARAKVMNEERQRQIDAYRALTRSAESGGLLASLLGKVLRSQPEPLAQTAPGGGAPAPTGDEVLDEHADAAASAPEAVKPPRPPKLVRYVSIGRVLTDSQVEAVRRLGIRGVHLERRGVRQYPAGDLAASIIGLVGVDHNGLLGAEHELEKSLRGQSGRVVYVRDASGNPLWIERGGIKPAERGQDLRLSIDLELQRIAVQELQRGMEECDAAGARLVLMDPASGEVLAMVDLKRQVPGAVPFPWADKPPPRPKPVRGQRPPPPPPMPPDPPHIVGARYITLTEDPGRAKHPAQGRNRCVEDVYEPGSTFKLFVWATITDKRIFKPETVIDTEGGRWRTSYGRSIEDVIKRRTMTWAEVLSYSSNIGMIKGAEKLSFRQLHDAVVRFGFGRQTGIGLQGEAAGIVTPIHRWSKYSQTSVAFGHEVAVTPVQIARAFCAFARPGELAGTLPPIRVTAAPYDPTHVEVAHRVLPPDVAVVTRNVLKTVVDRLDENLARLHKETGWRYTMFGKSGTAEIPVGGAPEGKRRPRWSSGYFDGQYNSSFVAGGPVEDPKLVIVVVIDDPGPARIRARQHYGSATAGPVARRVMDRALAYLGVPPSPKPAQTTLTRVELGE